MKFLVLIATLNTSQIYCKSEFIDVANTYRVPTTQIKYAVDSHIGFECKGTDRYTTCMIHTQGGDTFRALGSCASVIK